MLPIDHLIGVRRVNSLGLLARARAVCVLPRRGVLRRSCRFRADTRRAVADRLLLAATIGLAAVCLHGYSVNGTAANFTSGPATATPTMDSPNRRQDRRADCSRAGAVAMTEPGR
jgi:hypothetical protein